MLVTVFSKALTEPYNPSKNLGLQPKLLDTFVKHWPVTPTATLF